MGEIFISYASADAALAARVAAGVRQAGHRIFLDSDREDGIVPGTGWQKTLLRELRLCDAVVFLNSSVSQASMWCHSELVVATELGKRIYSLDLAPDIPPHPLLQSLQGIRFETKIDASIWRLTEIFGMDGLRLRSPDSSGSAAGPPIPASRRWMWPTLVSSSAGRKRSGAWWPGSMDRLGQPGGNLVVVMGPSGAGESRSVRAGLMARLSPAAIGLGGGRSIRAGDPAPGPAGQPPGRRCPRPAD